MAQATDDIAVSGITAEPVYGKDASFRNKGLLAPLKNPDNLAKDFDSILQESEQHRQQFVAEWLENYRQYHGYTTGGEKEPWQSDINVPFATQAVDTAVSRTIAAMFSDPSLFKTDAEREQDDLIVQFARRAILWQIRKVRAHNPASDGWLHGMHSIKQAIKDAFVCGNGYLKIHWRTELVPKNVVEEYQEQVQSEFNSLVTEMATRKRFAQMMKTITGMRLEPILPTNIWKDPTGQGRYFIQRIPRMISDIWDLAKDEVDPTTGIIVRPAVYAKSEVDKVKAGSFDAQRTQEEAWIRRDPGNLSARNANQVDVYEYYGDFVDPTHGVVLYRNILATFADKRITIRMPETNPFLHGKAPFISFHPKLVSHQVYGVGILSHNAKIQHALNRQYNIVLDKSALQVPTLEYDPTAARDSTVLGSKPIFKPGKMWARKRGQTIFFPTEGFQPVTEFDIVLIDRLTLAYQLTSTVSEFVTGGQLTTNRKTKAEVNERVAASAQNFSDAAVFIEETAISPMLEMIYDTMLQFEHRYDDPTLLKMYGVNDQKALAFIGQIKNMSPEERWETLHLDTEFRAVGISNQISKDDFLRNLFDFMQIVRGDPLLGMFVDQAKLLKQIIQRMELPRDLVLDSAEALLKAFQQGRIMQFMGQVQGMQGPQGAIGATANPHNQMAQIQGEAGRAEARLGGGEQPQ